MCGLHRYATCNMICMFESLYTGVLSRAVHIIGDKHKPSCNQLSTLCNSISNDRLMSVHGVIIASRAMQHPGYLADPECSTHLSAFVKFASLVHAIEHAAQIRRCHQMPCYCHFLAKFTTVSSIAAQVPRGLAVRLLFHLYYFKCLYSINMKYNS